MLSRLQLPRPQMTQNRQTCEEHVHTAGRRQKPTELPAAEGSAITAATATSPFRHDRHHPSAYLKGQRGLEPFHRLRNGMPDCQGQRPRMRHFGCHRLQLASVSRHADSPLFAPFFWPGQCSWRGGRGPHFIFQNDKNALIFH